MSSNPRSNATPLWKQAFDAVEKAAAPVMADATSSDAFAEFVKTSTRISRDMAKQGEELSRRVLHALNLPAAGDVAYLKQQIGSLEAEVRSLRRALAEFEPKPAATTTSRSKSASKTTPKKASS